jgi:hypothetical protein
MSTFKRFLAISTVSTVAVMGVGVASQAAVTSPTHRANTTLQAMAVKKQAFKGSYHGTIGLLWSSTGVTATAVSGHGTGTRLGSSTMTGKGAGTAASSCDPFSGTGSLSGAGSKLLLKVVSSSKTQACAAGDAAPTLVTVNGVAVVTGGTGKYKGAKGTLTFKGSFSIQATTAGSSESDAFTATLTGTLTVKK